VIGFADRALVKQRNYEVYRTSEVFHSYVLRTVIPKLVIPFCYERIYLGYEHFLKGEEKFITVILLSP
jgi:hypothetical protein